MHKFHVNKVNESPAEQNNIYYMHGDKLISDQIGIYYKHDE